MNTGLRRKLHEYGRNILPVISSWEEVKLVKTGKAHGK
jgi:hypothetical protein